MDAAYGERALQMSYPWRGVPSRRDKHISQEIAKYAAIFIDVSAITSTQIAAFWALSRAEKLPGLLERSAKLS